KAVLATTALLTLFSFGCNSATEKTPADSSSAAKPKSETTAPVVKRTPEQEQAIEQIEAALGQVQETKDGKLIVRLPDVSNADNETLKAVALLPNVERLYLEGPAFDDSGMSEVAKLEGLRVLGLQDTSVSGEGLKSLEP